MRHFEHQSFQASTLPAPAFSFRAEPEPAALTPALCRHSTVAVRSCRPLRPLWLLADPKYIPLPVRSASTLSGFVTLECESDELWICATPLASSLA